jgi:hypothetical protein
LYPSDSAYWNGLADDRNILWGDYFYVSPAENFAAGETLVHIEACPAPSVGNGAGQCPFAAGDYTFYGRYRSAAGQDRREPLATSFAVRYVNAGAFDGGTQLVVWRDTKTRPPGSFGAHSCNFPPSWFPLDEGDAVALGEEETPVNLCSPGDAGIPVGGPVACFPLATQRISLRGGNLFGDDPVPFFDFGWMYLNLDHSLTAGDPYPGRAQAWVTALMSAEGRFEVGYDAVQVDSATSFPAHGFVIIP